MKKTFLLLVVFWGVISFAFGQTPTLGTYPTTTIATAGGNTSIIPSSSPTATLNAIAYTTSNFRGLLYVNPTTGKVTVTNAQPAGSYIVTVKAFNGSSTASSSFSLIVNNSVCSNTGVATYYPVADAPFLMVVGDFNGDGKQDIISAGDYPYYGRISISLGDGAGSFLSSTTTSLGNYVNGLSTGDFNGDGKLDVMATGSSYVAIRLGNGNGEFGTTATFPVDTNTVSLTTGDFNKDGKLDFATASVFTKRIIVRLGDGTGNFSGTTQVNIGADVKSITAADFNGDGNIDLAAANSTAFYDSVSVRLGDGNGNFIGQIDFSINRLYFSNGNTDLRIIASDVNKDGYMDVIVAKPNNNAVAICLSNGNGYFSAPTFFDVGYSPISVDLKDINGDGNLDIISANFYSNNISVRFGDGTGAFAGTSNYNVTQYAIAVTAGDFNGDGKYDIIAGSSYGNTKNIAILKGSANEINIQGNSIDIPNGSIVPDSTNHTIFDNISNITRTYTIQNRGLANLNINKIEIRGADSSVFSLGGITLPKVIAANTSTTFTVSFTPTPTSPGVKTTSISVINDDCDESVYNFAIKGKAICTNLSANNTWLGITPNWNTPSNWSLGSVPNGCGVAIVNAGVPFMPQISTNATCYSLTLNNGATFTVTGTGNLTITGP